MTKLIRNGVDRHRAFPFSGKFHLSAHFRLQSNIARNVLYLLKRIAFLDRKVKLNQSLLNLLAPAFNHNLKLHVGQYGVIAIIDKDNSLGVTEPVIVTKNRPITLKYGMSILLTFFIIRFAGAAEDTTSLSKECLAQDITLQVLGAGGPELTDDLASSSYLIWHQNKARVLIDTGPGSSVAYDKADAKFEDLQAVLLTHLHVDHSADLPAYVKGAYFTQRENDLSIFGPDKNERMPSTSEFIERLFGSQGAFSYLQDVVWEDDEQPGMQLKAVNVPLNDDIIHTFSINDDITVSAVRTEHGPIASVAWRVDVLGCGITFSGDLSNNAGTLVRLAQGSKLLVFNNAIPEKATGAARALHIPPSEMGKVANQAQVAKVILSHFMNRTLGSKSDTQRHMLKHYSGPIIIGHEMAKYTVQ